VTLTEEWLKDLKIQAITERTIFRNKGSGSRGETGRPAAV
jgi:hypothetical protein